MLPSSYSAKRSSPAKSLKRIYFTFRNRRLTSVLVCLLIVAVTAAVLYYALSATVSLLFVKPHITSIDYDITYDDKKLATLRHQHAMHYHSSTVPTPVKQQWHALPVTEPYVMTQWYDSTVEADTILLLPDIPYVCPYTTFAHSKAVHLHSDSFIDSPADFNRHQRHVSYINPSILLLSEKQRLNGASALVAVRYHHFVGENHWDTDVIVLALKYAEEDPSFTLTHMHRMSMQHMLGNVNLIDNCFYHNQLHADLINGGSDSRLFASHDTAFLTFSYYSTAQIEKWNNDIAFTRTCTLGKIQYSSSVYITALSERRPSRELELRVDAPNNAEKNWLVFDATDVLTDVDSNTKNWYALYTFNPMVVLSVDSNNGYSTEIHRSHSTSLTDTVLGTSNTLRIHLSAGPVPLNNQMDARFSSTMLSVLHTIPTQRNDIRVYKHYFFVQQRSAPYAVTCINSQPIELEHIGYINFVSSIHVDNGMVVLGYGVGDAYSRIKTMSVSALLSSSSWQCSSAKDGMTAHTTQPLHLTPHYTASHGHTRVKLLTLPTGSKHPYVAVFQRYDDSDSTLLRVEYAGCVMDLLYHCVREPVPLGVSIIDDTPSDNVYIYIHNSRVILHHTSVLPVPDLPTQVVAHQYIQCINTHAWLAWALPAGDFTNGCNVTRYHATHTLMDTAVHYSITPYATNTRVELLYNNIDVHHGESQPYAQSFTVNDDNTLNVEYVTANLAEHEEHHGASEHTLSVWLETMPFSVQTSNYRQGVLLSVGLHDSLPNTLQLIYRHTSHASDVLDIQTLDVCGINNDAVKTLCSGGSRVCLTSLTLKWYRSPQATSRQADNVLLTVVAGSGISTCLMDSATALTTKAYNIQVTLQELLSLAQ